MAGRAPQKPHRDLTDAWSALQSLSKEQVFGALSNTIVASKFAKSAGRALVRTVSGQLRPFLYKGEVSAEVPAVLVSLPVGLQRSFAAGLKSGRRRSPDREPQRRRSISRRTRIRGTLKRLDKDYGKRAAVLALRRSLKGIADRVPDGTFTAIQGRLQGYIRRWESAADRVPAFSVFAGLDPRDEQNFFRELQRVNRALRADKNGSKVGLSEGFGDPLARDAVPGEWDPPAPNGSVPGQLTFEEYRMLIASVPGAIADLSEKEQGVLDLIFGRGLPFRDAAEASGLTLGKVKAAYERALAGVRARLLGADTRPPRRGPSRRSK
jgi:hypothetical protein